MAGSNMATGPLTVSVVHYDDEGISDTSRGE